MQAVSLVFPFRQTFQRLELEKCWWHRLCVAAFFAALSAAFALIAWATYVASQPQVDQMPDILETVDDQPVIRSGVDVGAILGNEQGIVSDHSASLSQFGQMIKAKYPVYDTYKDEDIARLVLDVYPQYRSAISDVPPFRVPKAPDSDGSPVIDPLSYRPIVDIKTIQMPDGSTSRFAPTVSDDAIKAQWSHAKTRLTFKALAWAGSYSIASALFISYLLQLVYRSLLYVIFGNAVHAG
jgi:hypothetical protein